MANIGNLVVKLQAQTAEFKKGMADARQSVTRFADAAKRQTDRVRAVFGALGGVVKAAMGALAAYGLSLAGISVAITRSATAIDQLAKHADKLGIAVNELQFLRFAADQTGVSMQSLDTGLQRMTRRVAEAAQGTGAAKNALEELGLSASQLNAMSPDQQFQAIAGAMANIGNQGDKVRLAMQIFDTEGVGLVNTMAANLEDLRSEFDELGLSLTRSQAAAVEAFNDSRSKLAQIFDGIRNHVTATVAPALQLMIDKVVDWIKQMGGASEAAKVVSHWVLNFVDAGLRGIGQVIQSLRGLEIAWRKVQMAALAVLDATLQIVKYSPASVIGKVTGQFDVGAMQAQVAAAGTDIAGQVLELERLQGQGGWTDVVSQQIEELRQRINESRSAEDKLADETKKGTEQTKRNTEALTNFGKGLTGGKAATAGSAGRPDAIRETTAGGKDSAAFDILINRFRTLAGTGQQGPSAAESFERAARTIIAQTEAAGGYDTEKMREQMEAMLSRLGETSKEGMKEAAQELTSGEGKSIGSITITVKSDNGETSGDVTGDTAFLSKLASTLQSVSTAV